MKKIIYYFTGTGNSLAAAKKIAEKTGECDLIPIASLRDTAGDIDPNVDIIGIVCPVYDCGVPVMVAEFAERLDAGKAGYIFAVVTMGGTGVSALHQLDRILKEHNGRGLDAGFAVRMPGNFTPLGRPPTGKKRDDILENADNELEEIARTIDGCIDSPPAFSLTSRLLKAVTYGSFAKNVHGADKDFSVSDACTSCGNCEKVCPAGNITLADGRPAWNHNCEFCCACLHFCPTEAIQLHVMLGTEGRGRYLHPDLKVSDMETQAGR